MFKKIMITGCIMAIISIVLGAMAAHSLEHKLTDKMLKVFETAARYQMYHSFAILLCGILFYMQPQRHIKTAFYMFVVGVLLFSGSLYTMSLLSMAFNDKFNFLGAITPIGGVCFIAGWLFLIAGLIKVK